MGWEGPEGKTGMWAQASSVPVWGFVFPLACSSNGANVFSSLSLQFATLPSSFHWIGLPAGLGCFSLNASSCFTSAYVHFLLMCTSSVVRFFSPMMLLPAPVVNTTLILLPPRPPLPTIFYYYPVLLIFH